MPALVFYAFSFYSPHSALADSRIDDLVANEGCELEPLPLVPPVPPNPAGVDALVAELRSSYIVEDSARWAAELGLAWNPPPPRMARQGVFGVPLFRLEGERFFGNDRLDVLVCALRARS